MNWIRARLQSSWEDLQASFWFVPAVMMVVAAVLAAGVIWLDLALYAVEQSPWPVTAGPDGARAVLATIATSLIGVAGVTFSITIVVLSMASSQFGARLLRTFTRDRGSQFTLGTFVSTFFYSLVVLRSVQGSELDDERAFVPQIAVGIALILAVINVAVLIYFIHHISQMIQAPRVIAIVSRELRDLVDQEYPEDAGTGQRPEAEALIGLERDGRPILASHSGYVRVVDRDGLLQLAEDRGLGVRVLVQAGEFVAQGEAVLRVGPRHLLDDELCEELEAMVICGANRSLDQDLSYPLDQLVEMAIRALSPSLNDPNTAAQCVDRIGEGLAVLASRPVPHTFQRRGDGWIYQAVPRVSHLVEITFERLRFHAESSEPIVMVRMLHALRRIARSVYRVEDEDAVRMQARRLHEAALERVHEPLARREAGSTYSDVERVLQTLGRGPLLH